MEKNIDDKLEAFEEKHEHNWQAMIYNLRRHLELWNARHVKNSAYQMKQSYLPALCNITVKGSTVTQIGRRLMVVKQNMSRTIKELEQKGMIVTRENEKDKRSERIDLTPQAKELVLDAHIQLDRLQEDYKSLVGEKNLEIASDVLQKIIAYHEKLNESNDDDN